MRRRRFSIRRLVVVGALQVLLLLPEAVSQGTNDEPTAKGNRIFDNTCSGCHGYDGEGQGELGFKLTSDEVASWTDDEIENKIRYGNLERGMPRFSDIFLEEGRLTDFGNFTEPIDFDAVVAYIRELRRRAEQREKTRTAEIVAPPQNADADPAAGRTLFFGKAHCSECHAVSGRGGETGPDLAGVATKYTRDKIYEAVLAPSRSIHPEFQLKELVFARGVKVTGIYRNETSNAIELYDSQDKTWKSYDKTDVQFYRTLRTSRMPQGLLDALAPSEVNDLLAFLESLEK